MKNATRPMGEQTPLQWLSHLPPNERDTLMRITLELRQTHGDSHAKRWLTERLQKIPEANETVTRKAPDTYEAAFDTAGTWSQAVVDDLQELLAPGPLELFRHLHHYTTADMHLKGHRLIAFQHEFFCIAEAFYHALGMPKATFYRHLKVLRQAGLVDMRGHCTTVSSFGTRCDGTIFAVKIHPCRSGNARVTFAHLAAQGYRDLGEDIAEKRTFWQLRQSTNGELQTLDSLRGLLRWIHSQCKSLQKGPSEPRFLTVSLESKSGLETVLAVTNGSKRHRGKRIANAAYTTARALGDQHSLPFWWRFYDALANLAEGGGKDYAPHVHLALERERVAKEEGFARNAAALFISRLKASEVYSTIMSTRVLA